MKIAIYETVHIECAIPLAILLKGSGYSVTFYVHETMKTDIQHALTDHDYAGFEWVYLSDQPFFSLYRLLNGQINARQYDLFWLNTNDSKHLAFAALKLKYPRMKMAINVHEVNNFFRPRFTLYPKQVLRLISKKLLSTMADVFIVNTRQMKENIVRRSLTRKQSYVMTPVFYSPATIDRPFTSPDTLYVVIPGSVDCRRKDYMIVLHAWGKFIEAKDPQIDATLILAGNYTLHGAAIAAACQQNPVLKETVRLFEKDIPEQDFQQILANATILLSPQHRITSTSDYTTEEYGVTKTSGNIQDAIRHAKPIVVPGFLQIFEEISSSAIRYSGEAALTAIFHDLCSNKAALAAMYQTAKTNSEKFSYNIMREKLLSVIAAISTPQ